MRRKIFISLFILFNISIAAQTITGILIDEFGRSLPEVDLTLYIYPSSYQTQSLEDGSFSFLVSSVEDKILPDGYFVSNSFPNPFNPRTRLGITLPKSSSVKVTVYNILGQSVKNKTETYLAAGSSSIEIELNGLPNGIYLAQITIDNQYTVVKKLMLIYGSSHITDENNFYNNRSMGLHENINKLLESQIDSITAASRIIGKRTFTNLPVYDGDNINLGYLIVSRSCENFLSVEYQGKTYATVQISDQCWLRENLNLGNLIPGSEEPSDNGIIEKYCYDNNEEHCGKYGGLYQWNEAMLYNNTSKAQGICPDDWHIPSKAEFETLFENVQYSRNDILAEGELEGTNRSGFTTLLGGYRAFGGPFYSLSEHSFFWTSDAYDSDYSHNASLLSFNDNILLTYSNKVYGYSVRCINDNLIKAAVPSAPQLSLPADNSIDQSASPTLYWNYVETSTGYTLQVSPSSNFTNNIFDEESISETSQKVSGLLFETKYYWRVRAHNKYGTSSWSETWSFTTGSDNGEPCPGVPEIEYAGKIYKTVLIGDRCWFKQNLDAGTMIQVSVNQTDNGVIEKYCYDNEPSNCDTYGALYQWAEIMNYSSHEESQGICPTDWHVPTLSEFETLRLNAQNTRDALLSSGQLTGYNSTGFSALLAGYSYLGSFYLLGSNASLWSSTYTGQETAFNLGLNTGSNSIVFFNSLQSDGFSVRCIKDEIFSAAVPGIPSLSFPADNSSDLSTSVEFKWNPVGNADTYNLQISLSNNFTNYLYNKQGIVSINHLVSDLEFSKTYFWRVSASNSEGVSSWSDVWSFTTKSQSGAPCPGIPFVEYGDKVYNTILIGEQCWLKENLDIGSVVQGSENQSNNGIVEKFCYGNDEVNCGKFGGLYQWDEAMQYSSFEGSQGICPEGWHLPSVEEFHNLAASVNNNANSLKTAGEAGGDNASGFSAFIAGYYAYGSFLGLGYGTSFWSSSETNNENAERMTLGSSETIFFSSASKNFSGFSVRCIKD